MKKYLLFYLFIIILISCNKNKVSKHRIGPFLVEGDFVNDTIMNGEMKYFDSMGNLVSKIYYKRGVKNGPAINFYKNGIKYDSVSYSGDLENGFHYIYDSTGKLSYVDFYVKGNNLGPQMYFVKGKIEKYYFNNFENQTLYYTFYDTSGNITKQTGELNFTNHFAVTVNNKPFLGFFAYFLRPPKLHLSYSLFLKDSISNKDSLIIQFDNMKIYVDTVFGLPTDNRYSFLYKTDYYDSLTNTRKVILKRLL